MNSISKVWFRVDHLCYFGLELAAGEMKTHQRSIQSLEIARQGEVDAEVSKLRPNDRTIILPMH